MNTALAAKNALIDLNQRLVEQYTAKHPIADIVKHRSQFVDALLTQTWQDFGLHNNHLALVAVGGYGRGELHPYSDIDLLFLVDDEQLSPETETKLGQFITYLWDTGLEIGHSVRTIAQTIEQGKADITIATNLIEARLLTGNEYLFDVLYDAIRQQDFWPSYDFYNAKKDEQVPLI